MNKLIKRSLTINAISNWLSFGLNILISFLLTPFIIKYLNIAGYGVWTIVSSVIGYYGLLDLGVTSAVIRYVALYLGQKDSRAFNEIISTSISIFCIIGVIVSVFSFFFSGILANFFNISEGQFKEFQKVTQILGLCIGISFPGNVFNATIRAQEYFIASNVIGILTILLRTLLIVYFLSLNLGLIGISYSYLVSSIFGFSLNIVMCILLTENFRPSFDKIRWESAKLLLGYGLTTAAIVLGDLLRFRISNIIIGKMISLSAVGIFSIASLIAMNMVSFIAAAINVLSPRFAALYGLGDKNNFNQLFMRSLSIIAYLGIGLGTLIGILGKDFIILWVGPGFLEAVPVLWILVIALTSDTCQASVNPVLYALKKHHFLAAANIAEGLANLVLSIILAPRYGIIGVALGTAIPMLLIKTVVQPLYISKILEIPLYQYFAKFIAPLGLSVGMIFVSVYLPHNGWRDRGIFALATRAIPYCGAFILLYFLIDFIKLRKQS